MPSESCGCDPEANHTCRDHAIDPYWGALPRHWSGAYRCTTCERVLGPDGMTSLTHIAQCRPETPVTQRPA